MYSYKYLRMSAEERWKLRYLLWREEVKEEEVEQAARRRTTSWLSIFNASKSPQCLLYWYPSHLITSTLLVCKTFTSSLYFPVASGAAGDAHHVYNGGRKNSSHPPKTELLTYTYCWATTIIIIICLRTLSVRFKWDPSMGMDGVPFPWPFSTLPHPTNNNSRHTRTEGSTSTSGGLLLCK